MDGFGTITWWGFTPALDLLTELPAPYEDTVNILLIGSADVRHILLTLAHSYRHRQTKINFYVTECSLELYARHILFMSLILEPHEERSLQEKTELFLELFGNSLVRQQTMEYVQTKCPQFIQMLTDFDFLAQKLPVVNLTELKFKERDMLEAIFKFLLNSDPSLFDINKCWDLRLRRYLGVRYDAIPNVFDWDFQMKLHEKDAAIIGSQKYKRWRRDGVAFELREATYDTSNRTLASGMILNQGGEKVARRGYWGDIIVSPYIAFGIESEQQQFFKKSNNLYTKTSVDVAQFNVMSMLHEVVYRDKYEPPVLDDDDNVQHSTDVIDNNRECLPVDYATVHLLPLNATSEIWKKSKFNQLFNIVYISNSTAHLLTPDLTATFRDEATVVMETSRYLLELTKDQHTQFNQKIVSIAETAGCTVVGAVDNDKDNYARFVYKRSNTTDEKV